MESSQSVRYLNVRVAGGHDGLDENRVLLTYPGRIDLGSVTVAYESHEPWYDGDSVTEVWAGNRRNSLPIAMPYEEFDLHWMTYTHRRWTERGTQ